MTYIFQDCFQPEHFLPIVGYYSYVFNLNTKVPKRKITLTPTKEEETVSSVATFAALGALMYLPVMIAISCLLNGWVFFYLWQWFIVPQFHVAALPVPVAIGIVLVVKFIAPHSASLKKEYIDRTSTYMDIFLWPFIVMVTGYVVHLFVR